MLKKNIEKEERKNRPTWAPYFTRKTKTKKDLIKSIENKYKSKQGE